MSLIHIGLHKTGTTSLQNLWAQHPSISLSYHWPVKLVNALVGAIVSDSAFDINTTLDGDIFDYKASLTPEFQVFSNEILSYPHSLIYDHPSKIDVYMDVVAQIFSQISPDAHILLTVREPKSWIASWYKSKIHIGDPRRFKKFIHQQHQTIIRHLDLQSQLQGWLKYFGADKVHIMPFELFRDDPNGFFQILHEKTGAPVITTKGDVNYNPSQSVGELDYLRQFQRHAELFLKTKILDGQAKEVLRKQLPMLARVMRQDLQEDDSVLARYIRMQGHKMAAQEIGAREETYDLPDYVKPYISETYVDKLAEIDSDFYGYLPKYREHVTVK